MRAGSTRQTSPLSKLVVNLILGSVVWASAEYPAQAISGEEVTIEEASESSSRPGVVVEEVSEGSAPGKAGLEAGNVVLAWERSQVDPAQTGVDRPGTMPSKGRIESVFDWLWLEVEQAPRGPIKLIGERDGEPMVLEVGVGLWGVKMRPRMSSVLVGPYLEGQELVEAGDRESGIASWEEIVDRVQRAGDKLLQCWLQLRIGDAWAEEGAREKARAAYRSALETAHVPVAQVTAWDATGKSYERHSDLAEAEASYRSALEIRQATWGESLGATVSLNNLGIVARLRGDLEQAEQNYQRAFEIRERLAPGSLELATSLNNLGAVAFSRGDLERATQYHQRALEIREKLAPGSLYISDSLSNLGIVVVSRGDLEQAAQNHRRALEIRERLAPGSIDVAASLGNLGTVAGYRGDLERAAEYFRRALEIKKELAPGSFQVAMSFNNLGAAANARGDLEQAAQLLQRALEIVERIAPGSLAEAASLGNLGLVFSEHGDQERAKDYIQRALEIREKLAPGSLEVATSLNNLGNVAWARGDLERATQLIERSLEINERLAAGSLQVASSLSNLGNVARTRGDLEQAARLYQRALEIRENLAPGSLSLATTLNESGKVAWQLGELEQAATYLDRSIAALEAQAGKLGGSHKIQGRFRAKNRTIYRDALELNLELDRSRKAFNILERSRARTFLAMLSERDVDFSADATADLDQTRRRLATRYDRVLHQMMGLSPTKDEDKIDSLTKELQDLRSQYEENMEAIRRASPKLAALQDPEPLDLQSVREALEAGTVLLSYSVGEKRSDLFVVTRGGGFEVHSLPALKSLKDDIELLRNLVQDRSLRPHRREKLLDLSHRLYKTLIEPAKGRIESGERVLIVPDGPLHLLPFGALVREPGADPASPGKFLVEWIPLHFALSGTVYADLKGSRQASEHARQITLGAFGDPYYPERLGQTNEYSIADVRLRSAVDRNLIDLQPLPASRWEVEQIAKLFPETTQIFLGRQATEERAKSLDPDLRIVHFAAHSYSDDRDPLSSAVALTIPEQLMGDRDNGLLQAWEIFERLRFNADLVVLSACETGLGHDQGGDGLISLSRAFQYAGARTVAASLWKVPDRITAELMLRFYRRLAAGQPKDAALRGAQLSLIRDPVRVTNSRGELVMKNASAPYYWAAFQIYGDWQ